MARICAMLEDRIEYVPQGRVYPPNAQGGCGVIGADGAYCETSRIMQSIRRSPAAPTLIPDAELKHLPGRHLFAGWLRPHFGHFLFESTPRLWALDQLAEPPDGIVFIPYLQGGLRRAWQRYSEFLSLFIGPVRVRFIREPTLIDEVIVPDLGFSYGQASHGSPAYRSFTRARIAQAIAPLNHDKIYISRSALPDQRGGVFGETRIEALMRANGYHILHPQLFSIPEQLAYYRGAQKIVALDGSALHMAAYGLPEGAEVAMIRRRSTGPLNAIIWQLESFAKARVDCLDVLRRDWIAEQHQRVDFRSMGELDFAALETQLLEGGFIDKGLGMLPMSQAEIDTSIAAMSRGGMKPWPPEATET